MSLVFVSVFTACESDERTKVIFDLPALKHLDIDQIMKKYNSKALSNPTEIQLNKGMTQWYEKIRRNGYEMILTYDYPSREVKAFLISTKDLKPVKFDWEPMETIKKVANISNNNTYFEILPVKKLGSKDLLTGVVFIKH